MNYMKDDKKNNLSKSEKTSLRRRLFALAIIPAIVAGFAFNPMPSVAGVHEILCETSSVVTDSVDNVSLISSQDELNNPENREIYTKVDSLPEFQGGQAGMMKYLSRNTRYPKEAVKAGEQGRVILKFVIEKDGSVGEITVVNSVSESLDNEAIRLVKQSPRWTPGKIDGKPVASYFILPISFRLQNVNLTKDKKK